MGLNQFTTAHSVSLMQRWPQPRAKHSSTCFMPAAFMVRHAQQAYHDQSKKGAKHGKAWQSMAKRGKAWQSVAAPDRAGRRREGCCRADSVQDGQQGSPQLAAAGAG